VVAKHCGATKVRGRRRPAMNLIRPGRKLCPAPKPTNPSGGLRKREPHFDTLQTLERSWSLAPSLKLDGKVCSAGIGQMVIFWPFVIKNKLYSMKCAQALAKRLFIY
jgi:hypothetical protein